MVDELETIEQLKRVKRLLDAGNVNEAWALVDLMIDNREVRMKKFEQDMWENMPV